MLGYLPDFIREDDPDPAAKQIDKNYRHGGGWIPLSSFTTRADFRVLVSKYAEDPPVHALFATTLRHERIFFYEHAIVGIAQPDGRFECARID